MTLNTIWYTRCPVPTPLGIAVQEGWLAREFAADGIVLKSLQDNVEAEVRESHFDHHLAHSFRQGGNIPAIWARARGRDTRVIGLSWTDEFQGIIALPGSGIRTPKDLPGRRLGLPRHAVSIDFKRAAALKAFETALELDGIGLAQVELVDVRDEDVWKGQAPGEVPVLADGPRGERHHYASEVAALLRGDVDAIFVKGVLGTQVLQTLAAQLVIDLGIHPDPLVRNGNGTPRTLTVDAAFIAERPDLVARFLGQVVAAGEWAAAHPRETAAYIGRETDTTSDWVLRGYGADVHRRLQTNLDDSAIAGLKSFKDFLLRHGFLAADFSVDDWIDPAPLAALSQFALRTGTR
jgi:ABC-type nitrate/sulfonate/bicarbonate transport system substrate-binding protein